MVASRPRISSCRLSARLLPASSASHDGRRPERVDKRRALGHDSGVLHEVEQRVEGLWRELDGRTCERRYAAPVPIEPKRAELEDWRSRGAHEANYSRYFTLRQGSLTGARARLARTVAGGLQ